jgi:hypothetical protein
MILSEALDTPYIISLRKYRNELLNKTDWVLTYDNALSLSNLDDWINYRHTLRDFFSNPKMLIVFMEGSETVLDLEAMGFPIQPPPILRKNIKGAQGVQGSQ